MVRGAQLRLLGALVLVTAVTSALVAGPARSGAVVPTSSLPAGFTDTIVWSGFNSPTSIAFVPGGPVFVGEKRGVIKVFSNIADTTATVFSDFSPLVYNLSDRGLLGLAVDPQLGTAGHNYVYALYTLDAPPGQTPPVWNDTCPTPPGLEKDGCVVTGNLARIAVNADLTAGVTKVLIHAEWCQQYSSHSVGHLAFGPDHKLYVSAGEGSNYNDPDFGQWGGQLAGTPTPANPCGDPPNGYRVANTSPTGRGGALRAQSPRRPAGEPVLLSGTLLRVKPLTAAGVPNNPFYDSANPKGNASRILAYGLRNTFRFTFRPGTSEVWGADVGNNAWEEIDRIKGPKVRPAQNFGWPCYEGAPKYSGLMNLDMCTSLYADTAAPAIPPYFAYNHASTLSAADTCPTQGGSSAISSIAFTPATTSYPIAYKGALFFGDYVRNCLWVMYAGANGLPSTSTVRTFIDDADSPSPVDLEPDPVTGDLFYVNISQGKIHRISYTG